MCERILKNFEDQLEKCLLERDVEVYISLDVNGEYWKLEDPEQARNAILELPENVIGHATVWTSAKFR